MTLDQIETGQILTGPSGTDWRVLAVNKQCQPPHILATSVGRTIDGALHCQATFGERALSQFVVQEVAA